MRRRARRGVLALVVSLTATAVLSACAGLPSAGPVNAGLPADQDAGPPDFLIFPDAPQPGATPQEIVEGFVRAGSGPSDNWGIARLYLAPSFRDEWRPEASVTIDVLAGRSPTVSSDAAIDLQVTPIATVDENGAYSEVEQLPRTLPFTLAQDDGQWRITEAPDGVVLDQDQFGTVFNAYPLSYFDPGFSFLVPDVRWFPRTNAATRVALALVDGAPSPWLAESVVTAFPDNVSLQQPAVPVEGGVAQVALGPAALSLDPASRNRMYTQLRASLAGAGATEVEMLASGTVLDAQVAPTRRTNVESRPLGLTEQGFGFLSGDEIEPIDGLSEAMSTVPAPVAIQLAASRQFAAARVADGPVVRVTADGAVIAHDSRAALIDPSLDPGGYVWSAPADAPAQLRAYPADGDPVDIADAWPGASRITAMEVSRDGTRIAAIVTSASDSVVWVAGIVPDGEGVPERLGDPLPLLTLGGVGIDVGWLGEATLGVLARAGDEVELLVQPVGGPATALAAPAGTTSLAGATAPAGVRLRDAAGALSVRRGSTWQQTNTGVLVLATQSGTPQ